MSVDSLPTIVWRVVGVHTALGGGAVVLFGAYGGAQFVIYLLVDPTDLGTYNLAIFASLLLGIGMLMFTSGLNMVLLRGKISQASLVPWQVEMGAGVLIAVSCACTIVIATLFLREFDGAAMGGLALMMALGIGFIRSGLRRRVGT